MNCFNRKMDSLETTSTSDETTPQALQRISSECGLSDQELRDAIKTRRTVSAAPPSIATPPSGSPSIDTESSDLCNRLFHQYYDSGRYLSLTLSTASDLELYYRNDHVCRILRSKDFGLIVLNGNSTVYKARTAEDAFRFVQMQVISQACIYLKGRCSLDQTYGCRIKMDGTHLSLVPIYSSSESNQTLKEYRTLGICN